jgi:hypothetical protein
MQSETAFEQEARHDPWADAPDIPDSAGASLVPVPHRSIIYGGGWRAVATSLAFVANGFFQS